MRIAMLASGHVVNDARVMQKQATSLAIAGHEVVVFGSGGETKTDIPGLELVKLRSDAVKSLKDRRQVLPRLYKAAIDWKPDVVTCHEPESAWIGIKVAKKTGAKMIFDVHELYYETLSWRMPKLMKPFVKRSVKMLLRHIARRADWITVVSPANLDFFLPYQKEGRVEIIHNSPRPESFPLCDHDISGPITICHEGNLDRGRGMVEMLEALALARREVDLRLRFLGKVRPADQTLFDKTVEKLDLAESIIGPQWINFSELGKSLSQGQIGIVAMQPTPNNYLSLSNKIYNYMACGMAMIVPKGSASEDLATEHHSGLAVDTTKPEQIAAAFVKLAQNKKLRQQQGANGRKAIEEKLGWHRMEARLLEIYAQLA